MPKTNQGDVSLILATRNHCDLLAKALGSIKEQSLLELECYIINDYSSDSTESVIKKYAAQDKRIHYLRNSVQKGCFASRLKGIESSNAKYISITDDDVLLDPERLKIQKQYLDDKYEVDMVCTSVLNTNLEGQVIDEQLSAEHKKILSGPSEELFGYLYIVKNIIPDYSVMFRREALESVGGYPHEPEIGMDLALWLKFLAKGLKIGFIDQPLVSHMSKNRKNRMTTEDIPRVFEDRKAIIKHFSNWLKDEGITRYNKLYPKALASVFAKQARFLGMRQGLAHLFKAWLLDPKNHEVRESLKRYRKLFSRNKRVKESPLV